MRSLVVLIALAACGSHAAPPRPPANVERRAATTTTQPSEVIEIAKELAYSAFAGDHDGALALTMTYDEVASLSPVAQKRGKDLWDASIAEFLSGMRRQAEHAPHTTIKSGEIVKSGTVERGDDIEFAVVKLAVDGGGSGQYASGISMVFLKIHGRWRFSTTM
jgi:hypothetical protein